MLTEKKEFFSVVKNALIEDKAWNDATSCLLPQAHGQAVIRAQQNGILAGVPAAKMAFQIRDKRLNVQVLTTDGKPIHPGLSVLKITGSLQMILSAERTALNFLSRLSGISTLTHRFVEAVKGTEAGIYDTRKTTPGLRVLEKYAVHVGGGRNHRKDLASAVLLKDNHLKIIHKLNQSLEKCVERVRGNQSRNKIVEIEAQNLGEVWDAIAAGADVVLLDNLELQELEKAMELIRATRQARNDNTPLVEISGGVTLANVRKIASFKPERISIGSLTHSAVGVNFNLDILSVHA